MSSASIVTRHKDRGPTEPAQGVVEKSTTDNKKENKLLIGKTYINILTFNTRTLQKYNSIIPEIIATVEATNQDSRYTYMHTRTPIISSRYNKGTNV